MKISTWNSYYLSAALYVFLSLLIGFILKDGLIVFLGWNMMLAAFVLVLTHVFSILRKKNAHPIIQSIILITWILFFPNALYITTDLIHLQNYSFFKSYPSIYEFNSSVWIVFTHILMGALFSAKMGIKSLNHMIILWEDKVSKKALCIAINMLFLLASLGIYIGRFMRFNSWQFYKVFSIISELIQNVVFALSFIGLFFLIHWVFFILFKD
jgi:uncharacterized membrane protein